MTKVYALLCPDTEAPKYVGCTSMTLHDRLILHKSIARRGGGSRVNLWIKHLLDEDKEPLLQEITNVAEADRYDAEKYWICLHRDAGVDLLNMTDGGRGTNGFVKSAEQRANTSRAMKGNQRGLGHKKTAVACAAISKAKMGHTVSAETRRKLSVAAKAQWKRQKGVQPIVLF